MSKFRDPELDWKSEMSEAIESYQSGDEVFLLSFNRCWELLNSTNVEEWLALLPPEFLSKVHEEVEQSPTTEDGWDKVEWFHIGSALSYPWPSSPHKFPRHDPERTAELRYRVELLRRHFGERGAATS